MSTASVADRVTSLVRALRAHGVRIGTGESVDAARAVAALGLDSREHLREGLAAALLHDQGQRAVFDPVFDVYFPHTVGAPGSAADRDTLRERLTEALVANDRAALARIAADAVDSLGGYDANGWSSQQTLDRLRPQTLLAPVMSAIRAGGSGQSGAFTDRIEADEIRRRIEEFRERVRGEARRRVAEARDRDELARRMPVHTPDRTVFLYADKAQLAELRRTVHPLARKLATRLAARRRRAARGHIDLRRTLRGSLSTGGVPMRPVLRKRRPSRPELVLLCDVSGSVAGFANFTMLLVQALHDQFSKIRVFAFVNRIDEVTELIAHGAADAEGLGARIAAEATLTGWHGSSDYGTALGEFVERYESAIGPRSTVFVLGDARNNQQNPNLPALRRITRAARRTYWLNPEPRSQWDTGDSAASTYGALVDMYECRNARQLSALVGRLLPV
ncbi:VWA domain-containing protein [Streptomyces sp. NPDC006422]|uniref:vWA domain-containing protein n=1 Tax=unclassified Streptomyces TaxID=2593676 RepID=UPI0033BBAE78